MKEKRKITNTDQKTRLFPKATSHRCVSCYDVIMLWNYSINLQKNTPAEVWFQQSCFTTFWNCTSAWVSSCKFAAYFQIIFTNPLEGCFCFSLSVHWYNFFEGKILKYFYHKWRLSALRRASVMALYRFYSRHRLQFLEDLLLI